ncbi:hypothetical protein PanWU01x14_019690 [Parasponia andersonii]|uniref:Uncharacterized protein n=1 Tax=Parasponia andersonii TaxID=3476 RepID=A0A2P5DYF6_PARAD|nr:hypothetical protein PanWU01x14_019690 [Parasponia andersonii]
MSKCRLLRHIPPTSSHVVPFVPISHRVPQSCTCPFVHMLMPSFSSCVRIICTCARILWCPGPMSYPFVRCPSRMQRRPVPTFSDVQTLALAHTTWCPVPVLPPVTLEFTYYSVHLGISIAHLAKCT